MFTSTKWLTIAFQLWERDVLAPNEGVLAALSPFFLPCHTAWIDCHDVWYGGCQLAWTAVKSGDILNGGIAPGKVCS